MWSWIKQKVKTVVRWVWKAAVTIVMAVVNIWDLLFGFLNWPQKKLTLHIVVLQKVSATDATIVPTCQLSDLQPSIDQAERILRERFNVKLRPYASQYMEVLGGLAPQAALKPSCCGADMWGQ